MQSQQLKSDEVSFSNISGSKFSGMRLPFFLNLHEVSWPAAQVIKHSLSRIFVTAI